MQTDKALTVADAERMAEILTKLTGHQWVAQAQDVDSRHDQRQRLIRPDGARISFNCGWQERDKAHVWTDLANAPDGYRPSYYAGDRAPSVNVSLTKGAEKIAADVARRLVPELNQWVEKELARRAEFTQGVSGLDAVGAAVARAWNMPAPHVGQYANKDAERYIHGDGISATISYGGRVEFKFSVYGPEEAERMARLLVEARAL